jgi:hypothetical protein
VARLNPDLRDSLIAAFRERVCEQLEIVPFPHQRQWWAASEGLQLLDVEDPSGVPVQLHDGRITRWMVVPRAAGRARFLADLGAFKVGKSFGAGIWATGFAAVPDARISLVGLEYDICEPEFSYICDALLSERGMNLKYDSLQNNPRTGKMYLDLRNGARFEARSWERKDSLKGKEIDAYIYCEAYQLPGIECFTSFSQNLRARRGYAVFATTPDRPWVKELHALGHGADPEWHCTCGIDSSVNPHTYDPKARVRDEKLMTREKFQIHYGGQLGDFVGRVFNYQRGQRLFTPGTHPELFGGGEGSTGSREDLRIPDGWEVIGGADTGSFYTALLVAFSPQGDAFVVGEVPNYRYVGGLPERDEGITIPEWALRVMEQCAHAGARPAFWADKNSQFKRELRNYGLHLLPATLPLEARTEIAREYFQHGKIHLAPWLEVLPFELENASWPEEATAAGKFARLKDRDHTLDCLEHVLSRRPRGRIRTSARSTGRWVDEFVQGARSKTAPVNPHLGRH